MNIIAKEVDFPFIQENMERIINFSTDAFMENHKITQDAFKATEGRWKHMFKYLLEESVADMMEEISRNQGTFIIAEDEESRKIVGISVGRPYGKGALSHKFVEAASKSNCCFKNVMNDWWNMMGKFEATEADAPPGKLYHQAMAAVDPEYSGKGIGQKMCTVLLAKLTRIDGYAVETSSESADALAVKFLKELKGKFKVIDVDSNGAGLTFRLFLKNTEKAEQIHNWFLQKKNSEV